MTDSASTSSSGLKDRVLTRLRAIRDRSPFAAHLIRMWKRYSEVQGNVLAGGITYFGFLSFFPLLALGFAVVGYVAIVYPDARHNLTEALQQVFPGIVTNRPAPGRISLDQIANAKAATGLIGLAVLLYTGLGWLSALRASLQVMFDVPAEQGRGFVLGKVVDLVVLGFIGIVMIVSVGISGVVKGFAGDIVAAVGLSSGLVGQTMLWAVDVLFSVAAASVLFFVMFRLLPNPDLPLGALWRGALLAAIGFEFLTAIVVTVLGGVGGTPFAPLAVAVTLAIWINYFSRLVLLGAAYAWTAGRAPSRLAAADQAAAMEPSRAAVGEPALAGAGVASGSRDRRGTHLVTLVSGAALGAGAASLWWSRRGTARWKQTPP
jgi:membrane protein